MIKATVKHNDVDVVFEGSVADVCNAVDLLSDSESFASMMCMTCKHDEYATADMEPCASCGEGDPNYELKSKFVKIDKANDVDLDMISSSLADKSSILGRFNDFIRSIESGTICLSSLKTEIYHIGGKLSLFWRKAEANPDRVNDGEPKPEGKYKPDVVLHPAETIREMIDLCGIDESLAHQLSMVFGSSKDFWRNLWKNYAEAQNDKT